MATTSKRWVLVGLAALLLAVGVLIASGGVDPHEAAAGFSVELESGGAGSD